MSNHRNKWLALAAGAFLLAALPLAAQEPAEESGDTGGEQGFTFTVDPVVFGTMESDVDTDSSKWQEYRDLSSGFVLPRLNVEGRGAEDRWLDFRAKNVRRDDARYFFGYGVTDRYRLTIDYNKIPHRFGNNGHLLWTQTAPGVFEIADPVQAALQGALEKQFATNNGRDHLPVPQQPARSLPGHRPGDRPGAAAQPHPGEPAVRRTDRVFVGPRVQAREP